MRWKASGNPRRWIVCKGCQKRVWARMEYRELPASETVNNLPAKTTMTTQPTNTISKPGCRLWIDGVGCWSLWFGDSLTLGGASDPKSSAADFAFLAPLSRKHLMLLRTEEDYQVVPIGPTKLQGAVITGKSFLSRRSELLLGDDVQLLFEMPNELSRSARLTCTSPHRPVDRSDGLLLVADNVMLGPGQGMHICCAQWSGMLVLFRRQGSLWCQANPDLLVNGEKLVEARPLAHGCVVTGQGLRMRLELES